MSKRTPADIAKKILEQELERVELTKKLILSLELMEIDPDFFGADGDGFRWRCANIKGDARQRGIEFYSDKASTIVQVEDIPQFTLEHLTEKGGNKEKVRVITNELMRRKRESSTVQ